MATSTDPPPVRLALVAAVARNGVIGARNALPWRLPPDLRHFRELTTGHAVIMGRRTFESIGRPLPERQNVVVTSNPGFRAEGVTVARSLEDALAKVALPLPAFCIGGGELYRTALPLADRLCLTEIDRDFEGDTRFPAIDLSRWREVARTPGHYDGDDPIDFAFVTYERGR